MNTILPSPLSNGRGARPRDMQAAGFDEMVGIIARHLRAPVAVLVLTDLVRAGQLSISTAGLPNPELSQDSVAFATRLINEVGVGLAPGRAFGPSGEGRLRLCFAAEAATLSTALDRLAPALG